MALTKDARISIALPSHPKTKKLLRRLGAAGPWHLVCLFLWAAANRSDGDLAGLNDEDIELAVDWIGEAGAFVAELKSVCFLDGEAGAYRIHDWAEHNPYANSSQARSDKARWAALNMRYGAEEAAKLMPGYLNRKANAEHQAGNNELQAELRARNSSAPSPPPSPSPSQKHSSPNGDLLGAIEAKKGKHQDALTYEIVKRAYHDALPRCQKIRTGTEKRLRAVTKADRAARELCKQQGWEYSADVFWPSYFEQCLDDPWLRGEVPNPQNPKWKQNLFLLIDEERFGLIMDRAFASLEPIQEKAA